MTYFIRSYTQVSRNRIILKYVALSAVASSPFFHLIYCLQIGLLKYVVYLLDYFDSFAYLQ